MTLCASFSCWKSFYPRRQTSTSLKVWGMKSTLKRLCKTQDLISIVHFFTHCSSFQASGLWVFNYLLISYYLYSVFVYYFCLFYLFVLLFNFRFVYYSFCFITSVNYWNISNSFRIINFKVLNADVVMLFVKNAEWYYGYNRQNRYWWNALVKNGEHTGEVSISKKKIVWKIIINIEWTRK